MIAVTPPIIFSKEVAQKQATLLPRQDLPHCQKSFQTKFPGMAPESIFEFRAPSPPGAFAHACDSRGSSRVLPPERSRWTPCATAILCKKAYKLNSRCLAGKVYPHEIGFQETRTNHRKLDSQATLSHRALGRATDGLRTQAWPLWASRRDHDPGRLSARPASLGGLRPAMAADRAIRGPPARSPRQERDFQRTSNPR